MPTRYQRDNHLKTSTIAPFEGSVRARLLCALTSEHANPLNRGHVWQERRGTNAEWEGGNLQNKNLVIKFIYGFVLRLERVVHLQLVLLNAQRHTIQTRCQMFSAEDSTVITSKIADRWNTATHIHTAHAHAQISTPQNGVHARGLDLLQARAQARVPFS